MFSWLRHRRRRRALRTPMSDAWGAWLDSHVWQHAHMAPEQQQRVADVVRVLVAEKHWTGCGGLRMTDEMRVAIAGRAALLVLGPDEPYYFDRLRSLLVYPRGYRGQVADRSSLLIGRLWESGSQRPEHRLGESWGGGPVILSWRRIQREAARHLRSNLVLHELAHHLDSLDGQMDGAPPMFGIDENRRFRATVDQEFKRLRRSTRNGEPTVLDKYGATDRAEFFAVATESFFETPHELRAGHTELYEVLATFYQQSPADWLPEGESNS